MLRAFIVEDSPVIRENLIAALEEMVPLEVVGYAEDEQTALQSLRDRNLACHLAIIDVFLRRGSGVGLLRALETTKDVPFKRVVLTNYATESVRRQCLELGAARVFDKSSELDALVQYCQALAQSGDGSGMLNTDGPGNAAPPTSQ